MTVSNRPATRPSAMAVVRAMPADDLANSTGERHMFVSILLAHLGLTFEPPYVPLHCKTTQRAVLEFGAGI